MCRSSREAQLGRCLLPKLQQWPQLLRALTLLGRAPRFHLRQRSSHFLPRLGVIRIAVIPLKPCAPLTLNFRISTTKDARAFCRLSGEIIRINTVPVGEAGDVNGIAGLKTGFLQAIEALPFEVGPPEQFNGRRTHAQQIRMVSHPAHAAAARIIPHPSLPRWARPVGTTAAQDVIVGAASFVTAPVAPGVRKAIGSPQQTCIAKPARAELVLLLKQLGAAAGIDKIEQVSPPTAMTRA